MHQRVWFDRLVLRIGISSGSTSANLPVHPIWRRLIFLEVQKIVLKKEQRGKEIIRKSIPFSQMIQKSLKEISTEKRSWKSDHVNPKYQEALESLVRRV